MYGLNSASGENNTQDGGLLAHKDIKCLIRHVILEPILDTCSITSQGNTLSAQEELVSTQGNSIELGQGA